MNRIAFLAKKIMDIGSTSLIKDVFIQAKWDLNPDDYKAGIYAIDIENALEELPCEKIDDMEKALNAYRTYTAIYCKYGYKKVLARDKAEANIVASKQCSDDDIDWETAGYCFKIAPSKYVHELRIMKEIKRVTHAYNKNAPMDKTEVTEFLLKNDFCKPGDNYVVDYAFIVNGIIRKENKYELTF